MAVDEQDLPLKSGGGCMKWVGWGAAGLVTLAVLGALMGGDEKAGEAVKPTTEAAAASFEVLAEKRQNADVVFWLVPKSSSSADIEKAAKEYCAEKLFCKITGFDDATMDKEMMPKLFPLLDREMALRRFAYSLNRDTGFEEMLFDCTAYPERSKGECLN